jgi:hypothetical protein
MNSALHGPCDQVGGVALREKNKVVLKMSVPEHAKIGQERLGEGRAQKRCLVERRLGARGRVIWWGFSFEGDGGRRAP